MEEPLIRTLEEQIAEKIKNYRKGTGVSVSSRKKKEWLF